MNKTSDEITKMVVKAYNSTVDEYIKYYESEVLNIEVEFEREIKFQNARVIIKLYENPALNTS